jgi:hypothetical protein
MRQEGGRERERERERQGRVSYLDRWAAPNRQRPEAGGWGRRCAAMPHGRFEQGRGREADRWAPDTVEGARRLNRFENNFKPD